MRILGFDTSTPIYRGRPDARGRERPECVRPSRRGRAPGTPGAAAAARIRAPRPGGTRLARARSRGWGSGPAPTRACASASRALARSRSRSARRSWAYRARLASRTRRSHAFFAVRRRRMRPTGGRPHGRRCTSRRGLHGRVLGGRTRLVSSCDQLPAPRRAEDAAAAFARLIAPSEANHAQPRAAGWRSAMGRYSLRAALEAAGVHTPPDGSALHDLDARRALRARARARSRSRSRPSCRTTVASPTPSSR